MKVTRGIIAAALAGGSFAAPVAAQERVQLEAGFQPDPFRITVTPGGPIEVDSERGDDCVGYISDAPSVRLRYTAGRESLFLSAQSSTDTVLVVRSPSGRFTCNDDHDDLNPGLALESPELGSYDIWVGTYDETEDGASAILILSEIGLPESEAESEEESQDDPEAP